jgi:hypothetical protein
MRGFFIGDIMPTLIPEVKIIRLYGGLGEKFGRVHPMAVSSPIGAADTNPANSRQDYTQHKLLPGICACFRCRAASAAHKMWRLVNNTPEVSSLTTSICSLMSFWILHRS